ncbi:hypothetical protein CWI66_00675 [Halomonas sp. 141]|uniref:hypothetical protein n=1 Tax=unclassified Halomonas TaxID=2609666 RepID=UPI0009BE28FB|nr:MULTISPECIES: hypothetical protein [unclassified Halomonas]PJX15639.1 hypothetical protein CWI66_00675 [Halomonas sp. 141]
MALQKLLRELKPWLTLEEAASRLANLASEEVRSVDLLKLGINGKLPLFVELRGSVNARTATIEPSESEYLSDRLVYEPPFLGGLRGIFELWDHGGMPWHFINVHGELECEMGGIHIWSPETGKVIELLGQDDSGAKTLPNGCSILVRADDIDALVEEPQKPASSGASGAEELRALEVLGLLAEALSQQHPGPYAAAGRPNRSGIISIMRGVVEGYEKPSDPDADPINLYGFGKSTLDEVLKAAIGAWEAKKDS